MKHLMRFTAYFVIMAMLVVGIANIADAYSEVTIPLWSSYDLQTKTISSKPQTLVLVNGRKPIDWQKIAALTQQIEQTPGDFHFEIDADGLLRFVLDQVRFVWTHLTNTGFDSILNYDALDFSTGMLNAAVDYSDLLVLWDQERQQHFRIAVTNVDGNLVNVVIQSPPITTVPEPGTLLLLGLGLLGIGVTFSRKKRRLSANIARSLIIVLACCAAVLAGSLQAAFAATIFADNQLAQNCVGNYSIQNRSCTGSDGDAYTTIKAAATNLNPGDTLNIRGGTYPEHYITPFYAPGKPMPAFAPDKMTPIQAYLAEEVVIHNATTKLTFEMLYSSPDLYLTFKNLHLQGVGAPSPFQNWEPDPQRPNVWRTPFTENWLGGLLFDNTLYAYACASPDALNASCRWYHDGQADSTPDGEPFIQNGMVFVYSPEGNPATAFTNPGIRPANGASGISVGGQAYVIIDHCEFENLGGFPVGGFARWWIKNSFFQNNGTIYNHHHLYLYGFHSPGQESIIEHNYFGHVAGSGIKLGAPPGDQGTYFIIRNNIFNGGYENIGLNAYNNQGMWSAITLAGSGVAHNKIYNNIFYDALYGVYLYNNPHDNDIRNNIFYGMAGGDFLMGAEDDHNQISHNFFGSDNTCSTNWGYVCPEHVDLTDNVVRPISPFMYDAPSCPAEFALKPNSPAIDAGASLGTDHQWAFADLRDATCADPFPPTITDQNTYGNWDIGAVTYNNNPASCLTAAQLISPKSTLPESTSPTLEWQRVPNATAYRLYVRRLLGGQSPTEYDLLDFAGESDCSGDTCSKTLPHILDNGEYVWWIQPHSATCSEGPWSEPLFFSVKCGRIQPAQLLTPSGMTNTATPTYTWEKLDFAEEYWVWIETSSGTVLLDQRYPAAEICGATTCSITPHTTPLTNGDYFWQVIGWSQCSGYGVWTGKQPFTINPTMSEPFAALYQLAEGREVFRDIRQTSDGGYIALGGSRNPAGKVSDHRNRDLWVMRLDATGQILWQKRYGQAQSWEEGVVILETSDHGYLIGGNTIDAPSDTNSDWDAVVMKIDTVGNLVWRFVYGKRDSLDRLEDLQLTSDGGYVFTGVNDFAWESANSRDLWVVKLNADGSVNWQTSYHQDYDYGRFIHQTADGGYLVVGSSEGDSQGGTSKKVLLKLDASGAILWQTQLTDSIGPIRDVAFTQDGGVLIASDNGGEVGLISMGLLKLDANGNRQWYQGYPGYAGMTVQSVRQTPDQRYVVVGSIQMSDAGRIGYWMRLTSTGVVETTTQIKRYSGQLPDMQNFWTTFSTVAHLTNDGGVIVGGFAKPTSGAIDYALIMKLHENGEGCLSSERLYMEPFDANSDSEAAAFTFSKTEMTPIAWNAPVENTFVLMQSACGAAECVQFEPLTLLAPVGTITDGTPTFTWQHEEHADRYWFWLQIDLSPTPLFTVQDYPAAGNCVNGICQITPPVTLNPGTLYSWSVSPVQHGCVSETWADGQIFTVSEQGASFKRILFDESHNQRNTFAWNRALQLNPEHPFWVYDGQLVIRLADEFSFERHLTGPITSALLQNYDALVISAPESEFTQDEIAVIKEFVANGGGLIALGDCGLDSQLNPLLADYGMTFDAHPIFEPSSAPYVENFALTLRAHPAIEDVTAFQVNCGSSLTLGNNAQPLAFSPATTWQDLNWNNAQDPTDPVGSYVMAAAFGCGKARVVALSDNGLHDDWLQWYPNDQFMRAALRWVTADKPDGCDYFMHNDPAHPGAAHDADKTGDNDSNQCWAKAGSNSLSWAEWLWGAYLTEHDIAGYFRTHADNKGSLPRFSIRCVLDGKTPPVWNDDWATIAECPTYYKLPEDSYFAGAYKGYWVQAELIEKIKESLHNGYGVAILTYKDENARHSLSVWGYRYDQDGHVLALWVTDSDDASHEPPELRLLPVMFENGKWRIAGVDVENQDNKWFLEGVETLKPQNQTTPTPFEDLPVLASLQKQCYEYDANGNVISDVCQPNDNVKFTFTMPDGTQYVCDGECKRITVPFEDGMVIETAIQGFLPPNVDLKITWEYYGAEWGEDADGNPVLILRDDALLRPVIGRCHH